MKAFQTYSLVKIITLIVVSVYFFRYVTNHTTWHFLDTINLIFHEAGHTMTFMLGEFISVLSGSLFQVLVPLLLSFYFFFKSKPFQGALLLFWVGQSIISVSIYAGDAVSRSLPLLGGEAVTHDWAYLLGKLSLLNHTDIIAGTIFWIGIATIITGFSIALKNTKK